MTNREIIENYNRLAELQQKEENYRILNGKQMFEGRIKVTYAIKKNMAELLNKIKPYQESLQELQKEYRNLEEERKVYEEKKKAFEETAKDGMKAEPERKEIFREGKSKEKYETKLKELMEIDVEDVSIHTVPVDCLDGLQLSSTDLTAFMFMLE